MSSESHAFGHTSRCPFFGFPKSAMVDYCACDVHCHVKSHVKSDLRCCFVNMSGSLSVEKPPGRLSSADIRKHVTVSVVYLHYCDILKLQDTIGF